MTKQDFIFFIVLTFDTRIHLKFLIIVYDGQYIGVVETKATQYSNMFWPRLEDTKKPTTGFQKFVIPLNAT